MASIQQQGLLLIADISVFTEFITEVEISHSEHIITEPFLNRPLRHTRPTSNDFVLRPASTVTTTAAPSASVFPRLSPGRNHAPQEERDHERSDCSES